VEITKCQTITKDAHAVDLKVAMETNLRLIKTNVPQLNLGSRWNAPDLRIKRETSTITKEIVGITDLVKVPALKKKVRTSRAPRDTKEVAVAQIMAVTIGEMEGVMEDVIVHVKTTETVITVRETNPATMTEATMLIALMETPGEAAAEVVKDVEYLIFLPYLNLI
jgi:hypothetical protein